MQLYASSYHSWLRAHLLLWECRFFYLHTPPVGDAGWDAVSFICCSLQSANLRAGEKAHQEVGMHTPEWWVPTCHTLYGQSLVWMHTSQGI